MDGWNFKVLHLEPGVEVYTSALGKKSEACEFKAEVYIRISCLKKKNKQTEKNFHQAGCKTINQIESNN